MLWQSLCRHSFGNFSPTFFENLTKNGSNFENQDLDVTASERMFLVLANISVDEHDGEMDITES